MTIRASISLTVVLLAGAVTACASGPSALELCRKLEAGGVGKDCQETPPSGVHAAATQVVTFETAGLSGRTGVVLKFSDKNTYENTIRTYSQLGSLNAEHRFGSQNHLLFVSLNEKASQVVADKAKGVVESL